MAKIMREGRRKRAGDGMGSASWSTDGGQRPAASVSRFESAPSIAITEEASIIAHIFAACAHFVPPASIFAAKCRSLEALGNSLVGEAPLPVPPPRPP